MAPTPPSYDVAAHRAAPWAERVRESCLDWVDHGFGAPSATYLFYVVKTALYVAGWVAFVNATPGLEGGIAERWDTVVAFQKAIVWTMLWESLGLGAGSGPLSGRYVPPVTAFLHFLWPGTIRRPPWPDRVPGTAGSRRELTDAGLYVAYLVAAVLALLADEVGTREATLVIVPLVLLGLRDKTAFLAARSEHYLVTLVVFALAADAAEVVAGSKLVAVAIWWWAATSKLNRHFPAVLAVMLSNHPLLRPRRLRLALFRDAEHGDVRPSAVPRVLAHLGTAVEFTFPLLLLVGGGGPLTTVGLVVMVAFHGYIISSVPLGVPIEWNVLVLYAGFVLFASDAVPGGTAEVMPWHVSPLLLVLLVAAAVAVPAYGNARPDRISFLPSMRYYAGNWPFATWLFAPGALDRLDEQVTKVATDARRQVLRFYDDDVTDVALDRVVGFRAMHLHGRAMSRLVARAVDDPITYDLRDGEVVCGSTIGWNFGDGHLHDEGLLAAVQERCGFAPGEVRAVFVESEPALPGRGRGTLHWRIVDAADGLVEEGWVDVAALDELQPWPDPADPTALPAAAHVHRVAPTA